MAELQKIPGIPGYAVDKQGNVWSYKKGHRNTDQVQRKLKLYKGRCGYLRVYPCANGKRQRWLVHRLIMLAFMGPCPRGLEVCHNNGNPSDNRLENLRYDTKANNTRDKAQHGTVGKVSKETVLALRQKRAKGGECQDLALEYNIHPATVSDICKGRTYKYYGGPFTRSKNKVTPEQVIDIRQRHARGEGYRELGAEFGMTKQGICTICKGRSYSDLPGPLVP